MNGARLSESVTMWYILNHAFILKTDSKLSWKNCGTKGANDELVSECWRNDEQVLTQHFKGKKKRKLQIITIGANEQVFSMSIEPRFVAQGTFVSDSVSVGKLGEWRERWVTAKPKSAPPPPPTHTNKSKQIVKQSPKTKWANNKTSCQ